MSDTEAIVINKNDIINSVNTALADKTTAVYTDGTRGSGYAVSICGVEGLDINSTQEQSIRVYMYILRDNSTSTRCFGLMAVDVRAKIAA